MPCYSYLSGNPILFNNNVEVVIAVGGAYSYSTIAWVCEFPVNEQLKVYKRVSVGSGDILLIETTHYTVNTTASTITFVAGVLTGMGQVVIRRSTPDTRMITRFVDGAKLRAKDLNSCFHQLLFLNQEKEFLPATINHYHSIPSAMPAWVTPFAYAVGSIVQNNNLIYRCIVATTANQVTTNTTYWAPVTPSQNGFVLIAGPSPVAFDFTNLSIGNAIIWDGAKFISNPFTGALASLTDVITAGAATGDVLIYSGTTSKWTKATPSFNMVLDALILKNHVFYLNTSTTSYNTTGSIDVSTKSFLSGFKNVSNQWVLTDAPTVYHIIQKAIPGEVDPQVFFTSIDSQLAGLAANVTNPVKVKFTWDLSYGVLDVLNVGVQAESLIGLKATFWDAPGELYSPTGYANDSSLLYHGVRTATIKHKNSPFYNRSALVANPFTQQTYSSKMFGYGVSSFYLSVPECRTSVFHMLPITAGGIYFNTIDLTQANLITSVNSVGNQSAATHRDYYLLNLRDMAFASNRSDITAFGITASDADYKARDAYARRFKGLLICADYDGIGDVSFRRLEIPGETAFNVLWKIPRNIIYYNKAAIALSFTGTTRLLTTGAEFGSTLNRMVRFAGYSELHATPGSDYPDSSTTAVGQGIYFKADKLWTEWCQRWSGSSDGDYRFNEADIDWVCSGLSDNSSAIKLFTTTYNFFTTTTTTVGTTGINSNDIFPWAYRPNDIQIPGTGTGTDPVDITGHIGTHLLNIDANKLFSEAHNFVPDPTDEYVFRLVVHPSKYSYFVTAGINRIKSSIILEYGFSDTNDRSNTQLNTTLSGAFPETLLRTGPMKSVARLDKSNVFVYIKREHIEQDSAVPPVSRYIITLAIRVPRAKAIGYSKVFRSFDHSSVAFPQRGVTSSTGVAIMDTYIDSGPWNFGSSSSIIAPPNTTTTAEWFDDLNGGTTLTNERTGLNLWDVIYAPQKGSLISGRNECAVKFTRIGIPSTLWVRLSVLNTDGEAELINSSGWI
jgi:Phage T7 tail fibre protein